MHSEQLDRITIPKAHIIQLTILVQDE